jgi:hypothetical protein
MLRLLMIMLVMFIVLSCRKDNASVTDLTGTWVKGTSAGDTLVFLNINGKHILRYNVSFNEAMPAYTETEYRFRNGKLELKGFMTTQNDYNTIESFTWKQEGEEFEVLGYQLYPFMSSTLTRFTFKKLN